MSKLKTDLGLETFQEVRRLMSLINHMGIGKPVEQIAREKGIHVTEATELKLEEVARERGIPLKEARELWGAFRVKRREMSFELLEREHR